MEKNNTLKDEILVLRREGKTYHEIIARLKCSKSVVSYHCGRNGLGDQRPCIQDLDLHEINKFYKEHSLQETADHFNVKGVSIKRHLERKKTTEKLSSAERKKRNVICVSKRRKRVKLLAIDYKGGECEICGYKKCKDALDFHHTDPNKKDFAIGQSGHCRSWERVKEELDKCQLVCANCHREIHSDIENGISAV